MNAAGKLMTISRKASPIFCFATVIAFLSLALTTSCSTMQVDEPAQDQPMNYSVHDDVQIVHTRYLLFLPQSYQKSDSHRWPVIVFLHGIGECGTNIWKTTGYGPAKYIAQHPDFPFIFVSPQCPVGHKWSDDAVLGILDDVIDKYAVDTNRVYLTGLSQGGYGVWSLATTYPDRFAAVTPISGGGDTLGLIVCRFNKPRDEALKALPIWAFHGGKDPVVVEAESERMVAALNAFGCKDIKLTVYPDAKHDAWTQTYDGPGLYEWFLKHEKSSR